MKIGKAIALIAVGVVMVYVGYFGIPTDGLPFGALVIGDTVTEDFQDNSLDLSFWEIAALTPAPLADVQEINQRLEVSASTGGEMGGLTTRLTYDKPNIEIGTWTITIDKAILGISPNWAGTGDKYRLLVERKAGTTDWDYVVRYNALGDGSAGVALTNGVCMGNQKLRIAVDDNTVTFSVGAYQLHSEPYQLSSTSVEVQFWMVQKGANALPGSGYFDNFYMTFEGGAPPPPDTGTVKVYAWDKTGSSYVSCTASLTDPTGSTQTINIPIGGYTVNDAKVGTWSVSGSYGSVPPTSDMDSGTLVANGLLALTLEFGSGAPPPPPPNGGFDLIAWFNSQAWLRQIFTFGGVALIGIPILLLVSGWGGIKKPLAPTV